MPRHSSVILLSYPLPGKEWSLILVSLYKFSLPPYLNVVLLSGLMQMDWSCPFIKTRTGSCPSVRLPLIQIREMNVRQASPFACKPFPEHRFRIRINFIGIIKDELVGKLESSFFSDYKSCYIKNVFQCFVFDLC